MGNRNKTKADCMSLCGGCLRVAMGQAMGHTTVAMAHNAERQNRNGTLDQGALDQTASFPYQTVTQIKQRALKTHRI